MSSWRASPEANAPVEPEQDGENELAASSLREEEGRRRLQEEQRLQEEATRHSEQERELQELERQRREREQQYAEEQRRQAEAEEQRRQEERQREVSVEVPQYQRSALVLGCAFSSFCKFKSVSYGAVSVLNIQGCSCRIHAAISRCKIPYNTYFSPMTEGSGITEGPSPRIKYYITLLQLLGFFFFMGYVNTVSEGLNEKFCKNCA